ncbi:MAG TPA: alpha/beta fold hydrolase [Ktedonobacterales bacterium]|jgi:alpha/beta superfamily hydrolase|nr:alpha/beta fold hydrolase [Ktedonobacterales bacterium]
MVWLWIALAVITVAAVGGLLFFTYTITRGLLLPQRKPLSLTPEQLGLAMEDVRIAGPRGELAAWYLPATNGCTLICCHGIHDNRGQWLDQVARLHARAGYGAALFDFAGHGHSEGNLVTYGPRERDDVAAIVEWLRARGDVNMDGLAIMGYSLGAIAATLAAASLPELRALVIESGFADLEHDIAQLFTRFTHLPGFPFANLVVWWGQRLAGVRLSEIRPALVIGQVSPRATLIISDLNDELADEPYDGERLYAAAGEPKELWQLVGVGHVQGFVERPDEWMARVGGFLDRYLAAPIAEGQAQRQTDSRP